ncbi:Arm DNA-binding domain-containing protein [Phycobacter sedimenti]|uniref:Arm DNA-binding domain-containing protein n=1 Tax=Phycobacter sedimenti TaxID=3133977 RepID=UPI003F5B4555
MLVNPNGSKLWRFTYRLMGKEKLLSFGKYPDLSLKQARDKRDEARKVLAEGKDPSFERRKVQATKEAEHRKPSVSSQILFWRRSAWRANPPPPSPRRNGCTLSSAPTWEAIQSVT